MAVVLLWPWLLVANSSCLNQVERWLEGSKIPKSYNRQMLKKIKQSYSSFLKWNYFFSSFPFRIGVFTEAWGSSPEGAMGIGTSSTSRRFSLPCCPKKTDFWHGEGRKWLDVAGGKEKSESILMIWCDIWRISRLIWWIQVIWMPK